MTQQSKQPKLTVTEAAAIMNVDPQFLRIALQQGRFSEFGVAVKMRRWSYYINAERFYDYLRLKDRRDKRDRKEVS